MKAEDTVMTGKQIDKAVRDFADKVGWNDTLTVEQAIAQAQAEISWAARQPEIDEARKAGIKEVMDYLAQNYSKELFVAGLFQVVIPSEEWQAKLKEE